MVVLVGMNPPPQGPTPSSPGGCSGCDGPWSSLSTFLWCSPVCPSSVLTRTPATGFGHTQLPDDCTSILNS